MNAGRFPCPKCGGVFQVDAITASGQVRCPHCRQVVEVPSQAPSSPIRSPPPPPPVAGGSVSAPVDSAEQSPGTSMLPQAIDGTMGATAGEVKALGEATPTTGISLEEPVKTAGRGRGTVELNQRSAEERDRRRRKKNLKFWFFCLAIILVTLALLVY